MFINDSSKIIRIYSLQSNIDYSRNTYLPVLYEDKYNQTKLIRNVIKVEDVFYYCKDIYTNDSWLINELIGSYLAKQLDLPSVDYQIGTYCEFRYALSKIFYDKKYSYYFPLDYKCNMNIMKSNRNSAQNNLYKDKISHLDRNVRIKLLKLIALDLKMGQYDRHEYNIMFKKDNETGEVDLAEIYDYGLSYPNHDMYDCYYNPFIELSKNSYGLGKLIKKHPEIESFIDIMKSISMEKILTDIEKEKKIEFTPQEKSSYEKLDEKYSKILEKISNRR